MTSARSRLKTPTRSRYNIYSGVLTSPRSRLRNDPGFLPRRGRGLIFGRGFDLATSVVGVFYRGGNEVKNIGVEVLTSLVPRSRNEVEVFTSLVSGSKNEVEVIPRR